MAMNIITLLCLISLLFLVPSGAGAQNQARADLKNGEGKSIGTANLRETKDGLAITVRVKGLTPGLHAVHVHEVGKCEAPKFTTAGGHFNPLKRKHGLKNQEGPHAGDLPNMYVTKNGVGQFEAVTDGLALKAGETSVLDQDGSAVVIHASADDYTTDPTGNAGDRIACGIITPPATTKK